MLSKFGGALYSKANWRWQWWESRQCITVTTEKTVNIALFWTIFQLHPMNPTTKTWCVLCQSLWALHYVRGVIFFFLFARVLSKLKHSLGIARLNGHATNICIIMVSWIRYMTWDSRIFLLFFFFSVAFAIIVCQISLSLCSIQCVQSPFCYFSPWWMASSGCVEHLYNFMWEQE